MRKNLTPLLILLALAWLYRGRLSDVFVSKKIPPALVTQSPCLAKKMCAVVYIAPWCPACNMIQPELAGLLKNARIHQDIGLVVVVGKGQTQAENTVKASELGAGALVDAQGAWHEALRIRKYPSFLVLDRHYKVVREDAAAREWINESFVPLL